MIDIWPEYARYCGRPKTKTQYVVAKCLTTKSYRRIFGSALEDDFQLPDTSRRQTIEAESEPSSRTTRADLETSDRAYHTILEEPFVR